MEVRYSGHPEDVKRYTTEELRQEFLIQELFQVNVCKMVYSHVDRMITGGVIPVVPDSASPPEMKLIEPPDPEPITFKNVPSS